MAAAAAAVAAVRRRQKVHTGRGAGSDADGSNGGTATHKMETDKPKLRLFMHWVPLYAPESEVRESRISVDLAGVGVSLIDGEPKVCSRLAHVRAGITYLARWWQELLYLLLGDIVLDLSTFGNKRDEVTCSLGHLQLNNQIREASLPVVLGPVVDEGRQPQPTLQLSYILEGASSVPYYTYATVLLQRLALKLDDELLLEIIRVRCHVGCVCGAAREAPVLSCHTTFHSHAHVCVCTCLCIRYADDDAPSLGNRRRGRCVCSGRWR